MPVVTAWTPRPTPPGRRLVARAARGIDWAVLMSTGVLVSIGALSIYAATRNHLLATGRAGTAYLYRDLANLVVASILAFPVLRFDYRQLKAWAPFAYLALCGLLLAVLTPLGATINGAHGWFSVGPVELEPSEFMKLAVIVLLAALLSERRARELPPSRTDVFVALVVAGVPMLLILVEPALGIALVIAVTAVTVVALAGAPGRWVAGLIGAALVVGVAAFAFHLLKPYQEERFTYLTHPNALSTSTGYQINQSQIAIGSGGLLGEGFLEGSQTDGGFVPEQQTDFIFTVSAEEGGMLAGVVLLTALGVLLLRGIAISVAAPDIFGRLLAGGIVAWLAFQSFVNVGMTLGIMPVTGLPLPFVSYGGSSLFADLLGVFLLQNIHRNSRPGLAF